MIQFVLFGLLFCAVASDDTVGKDRGPFHISAQARRMVRQAKWATFSTMSADGYPRTTVLSTAYNNGEIYFYMLNTDIPAMDPNADTRITFTFSDVVEGDDQKPTDDFYMDRYPTPAMVMVSGHVKELESRAEHNRGSKAFFLHHPEASKWDKSSYLNFSLCKLDITNVIVLNKAGARQITSREYYSEIDLNNPISRRYSRREGEIIHSTSLRLMQQANWATFTTILADGYPMTTFLPTAESNGDIFFNLLDVDMQPIDISHGDRVTFMFSDAQEIDCNDEGDDPWSPNCARAVITGYVRKVEVGTEQHTRGLVTLLSRHRNASEFSRLHFFLYRLHIINDFVLFRYGGSVTEKDYYKNIASFDKYLMEKFIDHSNIAAEVRHMVHEAEDENVQVINIVETKPRRENGYSLKTADRKGQIYLFVWQIESLPRGIYALVLFERVFIWGNARKLDEGTEEYNRGMHVLLWRHPNLRDDSRFKLGYIIYKFEITKIAVVSESMKATTFFLTPLEYYIETDPVATVCELCN